MAGNIWWRIFLSKAALIFAMAGIGRADGWTFENYMAEPNPVLRITEALLASASPKLAPELYQDGRQGVAARENGFLIDHSNVLPYPFSDRVPEDSPSVKK